MRVWFYTLHDPLSPNVVRYVGLTRNCRTRKSQHRCGSFGGVAHHWKQILRRHGRFAEFTIVESSEVSASEWREESLSIEQRLIADFGERHPLLNRDWMGREAQRDGASRVLRLYEHALHALTIDRRAFATAALRMVLIIESCYPSLCNVLRLAQVNEPPHVDRDYFWPWLEPHIASGESPEQFARLIHEELSDAA